MSSSFALCKWSFSPLVGISSSEIEKLSIGLSFCIYNSRSICELTAMFYSGTFFFLCGKLQSPNSPPH